MCVTSSCYCNASVFSGGYHFSQVNWKGICNTETGRQKCQLVKCGPTKLGATQRTTDDTKKWFDDSGALRRREVATEILMRITRHGIISPVLVLANDDFVS